MKRGDLVTIAVSGDYGKPRPALVVQADAFAGLRAASQVVIDKAATVPREKIGKVIGEIDETIMAAVSRALALFLGLNGVEA